MSATGAGPGGGAAALLLLQPRAASARTARADAGRESFMSFDIELETRTVHRGALVVVVRREGERDARDARSVGDDRDALVSRIARPPAFDHLAHIEAHHRGHGCDDGEGGAGLLDAGL